MIDEMIDDVDIAQLLPHSGEIVLLDRLVEVGARHLRAATEVRKDGLFNVNSEQVPSFIAIEYMAQAIAAWAGYHGRQQGLPVQPGLLLGSRNFTATAAYLSVGMMLQITVNQVMEAANGLAVFDAQVSAEALSITTRLSVLTVASLETINNG